MAQKPIREFDAKNMLARNWKEYVGDAFVFTGRLALVGPESEESTVSYFSTGAGTMRRTGSTKSAATT
jgi:hypothetical protein